MKISKVFFGDLVFLGILVLAFVLLFSNLTASVLWTDEASTGILARNCLEFGYPKAFDGLNWKGPREIETYGTGIGDSWVMQPWLQYYITALSFKLLGTNTLAARLPFVILGFFSLIFVYRLAIGLFNEVNIARLSVFLTTTSVVFLLHMRQCRYYALVIFSFLWILLAYLRLKDNKKDGLFNFLCASFFLFYSNHGTFVPVILGLFIIYLAFHRKRIPLKTIIICAVVIAIYSLPWYLISMNTNVSNVRLFDLIHIKKNLEFQIRMMNKYFIPFAFYILTLLLSLFLKWKTKISFSPGDKKSFYFILILLGCNVVFYCFASQRTIRYFVHFIPLFSMISAYLLWNWRKVAIYFAVGLLTLLTFTNFLNRPSPMLVFKIIPGMQDKAEGLKPRFYFLNYLYEITHDFKGPCEAIVDYLRVNAKDGDSVKIIYGDAPVNFYLPYLRLINDYFYKEKNFPEWIIDRDYWRRNEESKIKARGGDLIEEQQYLEEIKRRYQRIELDTVDTIWENRPDDLEYHLFRTAREGSRVTIYKRKH